MAPTKPLPAGTITLLFTDIEGSTRLLQHLGDRYPSAVAEHDQLLRTAFQEAGGHELDKAGDGFFVAFQSAIEAVGAAMAAQRALASHAWPEGAPVRVRMGLHTGQPDQSAGSYVGIDVHRAARIRDAGHGEQILLSVATRELVEHALPEGVSLLDLGAHRLKDLQRPEHLFQIVLPDLPSEFPPLKTLDAHIHNLPVQRAPLIGREKEVAAAQHLLQRDDVGLLTLTGPGGIGKTRLGLQIAAELIDSFADGVFLVDLSPVVDPALVISTLLRTLGVRESDGQSPWESLKKHLEKKHLLLLLDNFEQVVGAAPIVAELLATCPRLKVLVTSRAILRLSGEYEYPLPPLSLPNLRQLPPAELLPQYEAVRLFIERAQAAKPDFALTRENALALAEICCRLDGLPLAIELAAARIRTLPPRSLRSRLERVLPLLTQGARDLPARQQTLRGAVAWSHDLLDHGEQTLFRRLAVFRGGFALEAAEAVVGMTPALTPDPSPLTPNILDGVTALMEQSLLRQVMGEHEEEEARFGMLETIREYAMECLTASGEEAAIRRQHAQFFLALAEQAEPALLGAEQAEWLDRLEKEHDNLRAALDWSIDSDDVARGLRIGGALWRFWHMRGHLREGRKRLEAILNMPGASARTLSRAKALNGAGALAHDQGDFQQAVSLHEESLAIARDSNDTENTAYALLSLGHVAYSQGEYEPAKKLYEESLALWRSLGNQDFIAKLLHNLGSAALNLCQANEAMAFFEESLALKRRLGNQRDVANTLHNLAYSALEQKEYERAAAQLDESLRLFQKLGDTIGILKSLNNIARLALEQGDRRRATYLLTRVSALCEAIGALLPTDYERNVAATRAAMGDAAFEAAWREGESMTIDQAIEYPSPAAVPV